METTGVLTAFAFHSATVFTRLHVRGKVLRMRAAHLHLRVLQMLMNL